VTEAISTLRRLNRCCPLAIEAGLSLGNILLISVVRAINREKGAQDATCN
jgi:hypothetical protein